MKSFTKLYSDFWINPDNAELMQLGLDAQLTALYLQGNSHHNMLGVYYLPVLYAASDLKLSVKKVQTTLKKLCDISYCRYDAKTQYIWVCNTALEQLGVTVEEISTNDNRIKAIQAIWNSLPIQIDFLPDVYNKYNKIFSLKSLFDSLVAEPNVETPTNATNLKKEPSIDDHHSSISSAANLTTFFEGALKPLQSPPMPESAYNFYKAGDGVTPSKSSDIFSERYLGAAIYPNTFTSVQASTLVDSFKAPSKDLTNPSEAPSNPLQSPSEAPSEALRSNIEDRSKNIEEINKKKEIDLKKIETEEKKKTNNVLISNSTVQVQPYFEKPPEIFNSPFLKIHRIFEETKKAEAVDAKKQLIAYKPCNLPVVVASELETNPAPIFSVSSAAPVALTACNNAVAPIVYNGSVISISRAIVIIFEHWKTTMGYPYAKLDSMRKSYISRALQMGYTIQQLCMAITGCSRTPHNIGINDQGQRYDGIHIIFGDADRIDRFIRNYHHPPIPENKAEKRLRENLNVAKEWAKEKANKLTEDNFRSDYV